MTYQTAFNKIKDKLEECTFNSTNENYAIQIVLTNKDCAGILYIQQKDAELVCEPYDYIDNDVTISLTLNDLMKLIEKKVALDDAICDDKISVEGSGRIFNLFLDSITPPEKKEEKPKTTAAKKSTKKSDEKKTTKTTVKKTK